MLPYHLYPQLEQLHAILSRVGLAVAVIMFLTAVFIGLIRRGDVSRWFRRAVYTVTGFMILQSMLGLLLYAMNGRPYEEVHLVYGVGAVLALPFFIFVEVTAKKRPSMGSYMWGFALLAGIIIRTISTGAAG
jgi:heme A synthase